MEVTANIQKTLEALVKNGFRAEYFPHGEEAAQWLAGEIKPGETVAFGGSQTLSSLGLEEKLKAKGAEYLNYRKASTPQELKEWTRQCFFADAYFSSANAITEDGCIFNVDGKGNRVAATIFGPERVYIVAGVNKLCRDLPAARRRKEELAGPLNSQRLDRNTPCVPTGICTDCESPERICRIYVEHRRAPSDTQMTVVLIGEDLGY